MDTVLSLIGTNEPPHVPGYRGNGNGDDYKAQIDSQLSRLMKDKIPMQQLTNYKEKNNKIITGLNEIVSIIDKSKENFEAFKTKINTLKQKTGSGERVIKEADRLIGQQEGVGDLCVEQNRKIQECESEKQRLQTELSSKLENIGKKDGEIRQLTKQIEDLQKNQTESVSTITSANEELIRYNKSLVDKIKTIADSQGRIIQELDSELGQRGSEVESKINSIKDKLIGLVDSIDDENNGLGPPQVYRNGRQQPPPNLPLGLRNQGPIAIPEQTQRDVLTQSQESKGGPVYGNSLYRRGGKRKKSRRLSKKGGKGKKHRMLKTRSKK